jgi:hypothetical protein
MDRSLIKVSFLDCNPMVALYARDRRSSKFTCIGSFFDIQWIFERFKLHINIPCDLLWKLMLLFEGHTELQRGFVNPVFQKCFTIPFVPWDHQELVANVFDIVEANGVKPILLISWHSFYFIRCAWAWWHAYWSYSGYLLLFWLYSNISRL